MKNHRNKETMTFVQQYARLLNFYLKDVYLQDVYRRFYMMRLLGFERSARAFFHFEYIYIFFNYTSTRNESCTLQYIGLSYNRFSFFFNLVSSILKLPRMDEGTFTGRIAVSASFTNITARSSVGARRSYYYYLLLLLLFFFLFRDAKLSLDSVARATLALLSFTHSCSLTLILFFLIHFLFFFFFCLFSFGFNLILRNGSTSSRASLRILKKNESRRLDARTFFSLYTSRRVEKH